MMKRMEDKHMAGAFRAGVVLLALLVTQVAMARAQSEDGSSTSSDDRQQSNVAVGQTGGTDMASSNQADGTSSQAVEGPSAPQTEPGVSYGTGNKLNLDEMPKDYEGPKKYTLSLAGGGTWFAAGKVANDTYPYTPSFRFQLGRQFFSQIQLQLDIGFVWDVMYLKGETSGDNSGDTMTLHMWPASLGAVYRFDYFEEQALVLYFGGGVAGALVNAQETNDVSGANESTSRHWVGTYFGGGLELLLDKFGPQRAADLELASGINDSYIVVDVRYYRLEWYFSNSSLVSEDSDVLFDGLQVTAGLKFDF